MSKIDLAVVIPTRRRHERLAEIAQNFKDTTPRHRLLFVVDWDDPESEKEASKFGRIVKLTSRCDYVTAANAGIAATKDDFVLVGGDDAKPHPGWFEAAKAKMSDTIGFVALNDLGNPWVQSGIYATFPLLARWYIDKYGKVFDEVYTHNWSDVDASLWARKREAFAYAEDAVMEHLHPSWGKGKVDDTYAYGGLNVDLDRIDHQLAHERWGDEMRALGL